MVFVGEEHRGTSQKSVLISVVNPPTIRTLVVVGKRPLKTLWKATMKTFFATMLGSPRPLEGSSLRPFLVCYFV